MKSGFVAIIGRPNAGKSTLLNSLLNDNISIVTHKAQTTRNSIHGIYNYGDLQIIFIDTPGIHSAITNLGSYMNKEAMSEAYGCDIIYYIVDASKGIGNDDKDILSKLFTYDTNIFLLLNKIDLISKERLIDRISYASSLFDFKEIIPISASNDDNVDELLKVTSQYLKDDIQYYPNNINTDITDEFRISEVIRKNIILNTKQEVPHLTAVKIDTLEFKENRVNIEATIICAKSNHKSIIIGRNGSMLKKINTSSIIELKHIYGKKINLSLFVKVDEDWLNSNNKLFELGYFKGDKDE